MDIKEQIKLQEMYSRQAKGEQPVTVDEQPVTVDEQPVTVDEQPVTVDEQPVTVDEQPVTVDWQAKAKELRDASPSDEVKVVAEVFGIEYTNKRETLAAIREKANG